jgi:hypothetical protein
MGDAGCGLAIAGALVITGGLTATGGLDATGFSTIGGGAVLITGSEMTGGRVFRQISAFALSAFEMISAISFSTLADFAAGEIFKASSSRTESLTIVPQLGQTDRVEARFLLQAGQFIVLKIIENWNCSSSESREKLRL